MGKRARTADTAPLTTNGHTPVAALWASTAWAASSGSPSCLRVAAASPPWRVTSPSVSSASRSCAETGEAPDFGIVAEPPGQRRA